MTSIFKDFEKVSKEEAENRFVSTPTVEQLYELDKAAVSDFLDGDKKAVKDKAEEISKKDPEEISGVEQLYLKVAGCVNYNPPKDVIGAEGLFGTVWSLIKRFFSMIGNFFKWLGETFFGFGKRSQADLDKLQAKIRAGEINYDAELNYPANAKLILDGKKFKSYPNNLDWLRKELDFNYEKMDLVEAGLKEAGNLFKLVQEKNVRIEHVDKFVETVTNRFGGKVTKVKEGSKTEPTAYKLIGTMWFSVTLDEDKHNVAFIEQPIKQTEVTDKSTFSVSKSVYGSIADKLKDTALRLNKLASISKDENKLFNIKMKTENDLSGMGKAEAYAMAYAMRTLVSYISFVKTAMSAMQRVDTAAHDIMAKAFK